MMKMICDFFSLQMIDIVFSLAYYQVNFSQL